MNNIAMKGAVLALASAVCAVAASTQTAKNKPQVWRYDGVGETEKDGTRFMAVWVLDPMSKFSIDIITYRYYVPIPGAEGDLALPPDEKIMKSIRAFTKGDLVDVYTSADNILTRIEHYSGPPGEDMPDSRLFVQLTTKTLNKSTFPAVTLRKFGRDHTYPIGHMDTTGKWVPDESLAKKLKAFKTGDFVEVDLRPEEPNVLRMGMEHFLAGMEPYEMPQVGTVLEVKVEGAEGKPATVRLRVEETPKPVTLYHKGGPTLEAGQEVWFRVVSTDGEEYFKFICWKKN